MCLIHCHSIGVKNESKTDNDWKWMGIHLFSFFCALISGETHSYLLMLITPAIFNQMARNLQYFALLSEGIICANVQGKDTKNPFYKQYKSALIHVSFPFIFRLRWVQWRTALAFDAPHCGFLLPELYKMFRNCTTVLQHGMWTFSTRSGPWNQFYRQLKRYKI